MLIEAKGKRLRLLRKKLLELDHDYFRNFGRNRYPFENKGNYYYCFIDDIGNFAGYAMLRTFNRYNNPTMGIAIWEKYRGKGKGEQCLRELIQKAKEIGFSKIKLHTFHNYYVAIHLYKKLGFEIIEEKNNRLFMVKEI